MRQWTRSPLVQVMAWRLLGAKPLPEPMLAYCQSESWEQISMKFELEHFNDVIMSAIASQITGVAIVCSTVGSGPDQRKHQSSASLAFVRGIHRDRCIASTKDSYAENVSIWWRHHVLLFSFKKMHLKMPSAKLAAIFFREGWINTGNTGAI